MLDLKNDLLVASKIYRLYECQICKVWVANFFNGFEIILHSIVQFRCNDTVLKDDLNYINCFNIVLKTHYCLP